MLYFNYISIKLGKPKNKIFFSSCFFVSHHLSLTARHYVWRTVRTSSIPFQKWACLSHQAILSGNSPVRLLGSWAGLGLTAAVIPSSTSPHFPPGVHRPTFCLVRGLGHQSDFSCVSSPSSDFSSLCAVPKKGSLFLSLTLLPQWTLLMLLPWCSAPDQETGGDCSPGPALILGEAVHLALRVKPLRILALSLPTLMAAGPCLTVVCTSGQERLSHRFASSSRPLLCTGMRSRYQEVFLSLL